MDTNGRVRSDARALNAPNKLVSQLGELIRPGPHLGKIPPIPSSPTQLSPSIPSPVLFFPVKQFVTAFNFEPHTMFSLSLLPLLALASGALAAPAGLPTGGLTGGRVIPGFGAAAFSPFMNIVGCPVSSDVLSLPTNQTVLAIPDGTKPVAIALGLSLIHI